MHRFAYQWIYWVIQTKDLTTIDRTVLGFPRMRAVLQHVHRDGIRGAIETIYHRKLQFLLDWGAACLQ